MSDRGRRLTVQGWQNLVLSAMGLVVLVGLVAGGLLMQRTDRLSRELIDYIQPARVQAYALQAALRDQETAVRGYVITADEQFLAPYYSGQDAEKEAAQNVRERVGAHSELLDRPRRDRAGRADVAGGICGAHHRRYRPRCSCGGQPKLD